MAIQLKPTKPGPLWRFLSSVWLGISLMLVTALMAGLGHFAGFKETEEIFFGSWWFSGLMLTLALNLTIATLDRAQTSAPGWFLYRLSQIPWLILHTGLVIIILGNALTRGLSQDGQIYIQEGTSERTILMNRQELQVDHVKAGARETETAPIKLTHLPQTDDLSTRRDTIAVIGRVFWLAFAALAGSAALLISRSKQVALRVVGFFVVTGIAFDYFATRAANFTRKVPGATVTFERYIPHHTVTHPIVADPSSSGPRAVEVGVTADMGGPRPVVDTRWIPLMQGQAFSQEELQRLVDAGQGSWDNLANGVLIAVQQVGSKEELERLLAGQESLGHAEITAGGETKRVPLDPLVQRAGNVGTIDADVVVGGHKVRLQQFMWQMQVNNEDNIARDAAPGGPLGATACLRVASVTAPDGKVDAPPRPYHFFANSEIRALAKDMARPAGVEVKLELPTWAIPPGRCVHIVLGPEPGLVRLFSTGFGAGLPATADELLKTKPAKPEGDMIAGLKMPLVFKVKQVVASVMRTSEHVAADPDDPNADKYPDAVFVRLRPDSDPKKELTGWLGFAFASDDPTSKLFLQDGDEVWTLHYRAQRRVLPFEVFLRDFRIRWAPGSENVREEAFESTVTVSDPKPAAGAPPAPGARNASFDYDIYMNHTLEHDFWTLFQSSYIKGPPGSPDISVFAVQNDPGKWPFYIGALALSMGVFGIFFVKPKLRQIELARRGQAPKPAAEKAKAEPATPAIEAAPTTLEPVDLPDAVGAPVSETVPPTAEAKPAEPPVG